MKVTFIITEWKDARSMESGTYAFPRSYIVDLSDYRISHMEEYTYIRINGKNIFLDTDDKGNFNRDSKLVKPSGAIVYYNCISSMT